jgi:hypothetical protein
MLITRRVVRDRGRSCPLGLCVPAGSSVQSAVFNLAADYVVTHRPSGIHKATMIERRVLAVNDPGPAEQRGLSFYSSN